MSLKNFPPGPLDFYRKKASFDWKKLKVFIDSEEIVQFENDLWEVLKSHPEFQCEPFLQSLDDKRRITTRRTLAQATIELLSPPQQFQNLKRPAATARTMIQFTPSANIKFFLGTNTFVRVLRSLGTERHSEILEQVENGEIHGCFCLTEIGHGSNIKSMRTTATYDKETQQFIMDTPDFEAAKCWAGGLGQMSSYAIVYAQLYVDGVLYGLHVFVVPIRNPKNLEPFPRVTVGDMGEKIGLNGMDNGFLIFDKYRIPRENLLNKNADVTPDGKYVTHLKTTKDRYGATLGALSVGRVGITTMADAYGTKALTIAIRYAAVRKQFGPSEGEEVPILEYQSHQVRLLPYLAAIYVIRTFSTFLLETTCQFVIDSLLGKNKESLPEIGFELHVVSSASKPVATWLFRDAIQECREACGGHGYLKVAGIGDIRNDNDANCTYEGENHVLIQQTSNWLLKLWSEIEKGVKVSTPMKSANFLSLQILTHRFRASDVDTACKPEAIIDAYRWLVCYLLKETRSKFDSLVPKQGEFHAKNNTQVFYAKNAAISFIQHFFLQRMLGVIDRATDSSIRNILLKLFSLYGLWSLEKFLATFYEGGYFQGPRPAQIIHEAILKLCSEIKDDAVSLIDAVAPPDFILNSVLGASDGQVYQRLQAALLYFPNSMTRPKWWREIVNDNNQSKL